MIVPDIVICEPLGFQFIYPVLFHGHCRINETRSDRVGKYSAKRQFNGQGSRKLGKRGLCHSICRTTFCYAFMVDRRNMNNASLVGKERDQETTSPYGAIEHDLKRKVPDWKIRTERGYR